MLPKLLFPLRLPTKIVRAFLVSPMRVTRPNHLILFDFITLIIFVGQCKLRGPFAKFLDSPYYSESELYGGAVTVSFSKYLRWWAMHFLQRSTHISKTCCRPLITSKFLISELPFRGWKSPEIAWGEIWIEFCVRFGKNGSVEPH
jgi:hypothetical protein